VGAGLQPGAYESPQQVRKPYILIAIFLLVSSAAATVAIDIPKVWDDAALATMELPLATPEASPKHVSSDFYYRIPVRPIYKSYPIYAPGKEPSGYLEWLQQQEPQVAFDASRLVTEADWQNAGEIVFDAPIGFDATFRLSQVRDPVWHERLRVPVASDGIIPFARYVIRKKGEVQVGTGSCAMCHTRVLPGGRVVKGAQGNLAVDRAIGVNLRAQYAAATDKRKFLEDIRLAQRLFFGVPWLKPDPLDRIARMSLEEIASAYDAIPPGVTTRVNLSVFVPAQIPDLIGVCDLKHLDHTGVVRQRSAADLMRYAALVQGGNSFDRFGEFDLMELTDNLPEPERLQRYSDEQLYALARFICSLRPPANPNPFDATARRGKAVFEREGCARCHTPPHTSNELIPAEVVGTDPALTLQTRKGTGYYKVPSLRGAWYRGPLQHSGAVRTLEDWFDRRRLGTVAGHRFGLNLPENERDALIAFLRTL
jgi:mono/diheme cytochrome c family protein